MSDLLQLVANAYASDDDDDQEVDTGNAGPLLPNQQAIYQQKQQYPTKINIKKSIFKENDLSDDENDNKKKAEFKQISSKLGKRNKNDDDNDDENEEEQYDLMKRARHSIVEQNKQEMKTKSKLKLDKVSTKLDEESTRQKLQNVDPIAQKLFSMLPPAKSNRSVTISSALRQDTEITVIPYVSDDDEDDLKRFEDNDDQNQESKDTLVNVSGANLLDKNEFQRNQIKKHSLQMFRNQTLERMQQYEDSGNLKQQGRAKNQLASLGGEEADLLQSFEDQNSKNRDEFRAKKSRYGW